MTHTCLKQNNLEISLKYILLFLEYKDEYAVQVVFAKQDYYDGMTYLDNSLQMKEANLIRNQQIIA
jgi:hypothetical protein